MTKAAEAAGTIGTRVPFFLERRVARLTVPAVEEMDPAEYASYAFGWRSKKVMLRNLRVRGEE